MNYLLSLLVFMLAFLLLGIGLIVAKKTLKKGCSLGPDCTCKNTPEDSSSKDCEHRIE